MKESLLEQPINEKDLKIDKKIQEKILRAQPIPGAAGFTYGKAFDDRCCNNEQEPGETFMDFYNKMKEVEEDNGDNNPVRPYSKAA